MARGWLPLLLAFLDSLVAASPTVHLVLMAEGETLDAVAATTSRLLPGHFHPLPLRGFEAAAPKAWRRLYVNKARYFGYKQGMDIVRRLAAEAPPPSRDARGCADWAAAPLVLLTDTRDVVFQRDPFVTARALIATTAAAAATTTGRCALPPLLAVAEPAAFLMGDDPKNDPNQAAIFRREADALWAGSPPLCSGTTLAAVPAMEAYVDAMVAGMPLAAPGSAATDQALHIALIAVGAKLQRGEAEWPPGGGAGGGAHPTPLPLLSEDAYVRLYGIAAALAAAAHLLVVPHEAGWVCTMSLFSLEHCWVFDEPAAGVVGAARGGDSSGPLPLLLSPAVGAPPCDVIHQWDREALHFLTTAQAFAGEGRRAALPPGWQRSAAVEGGTPAGERVVARSPVSCNRNFFSSKYEDCYQLEDVEVDEVGRGNATTRSVARDGELVGATVIGGGVQGVRERAVHRRIVWVDARTQHPEAECATAAEVTAARWESARRRGQ